ncbi:MAG: TetR/AcrR family transcriptional regulator [Tissierellia bacterium]|nr:TetR/AcrR family transcriptional regulator [Tissierellia bacterium]
MAPRIKITRQSIIDATIEIIRRYGEEQVNARDIARELGCSTQPIFSNFKNTDELRSVVGTEVKKMYYETVFDGIDKEKPYESLISGYIHFAKAEKNLFRLLFMSEMYEFKSFKDLLEPEDERILNLIIEDKRLTREQAEKLYISMRFFLHGMASYLARNICDADQDEMFQLLDTGLNGMLQRYQYGKLQS